MSATHVFDNEYYEALNEARAQVLRRLMPSLIREQKLETAVDVACGLGYFSRFLRDQGLRVTGVDGRLTNVDEARRRTPDLKFCQFDAENPDIVKLGPFDLVLCFGLLYHLENPLLAIRLLLQLTSQVLLVESVIHPGDEPIMALIDEASTEDQGLNHFAFYPTEACLIKMLYRAGFTFVYNFAKLPEHAGYRPAAGWRKSRTMLAASRERLNFPQLVAAAEPKSDISPWDPGSGVSGSKPLNRLLRFAQRPMDEKLESIRRILKGQ